MLKTPIQYTLMKSNKSVHKIDVVRNGLHDVIKSSAKKKDNGFWCILNIINVYYEQYNYHDYNDDDDDENNIYNINTNYVNIKRQRVITIPTALVS